MTDSKHNQAKKIWAWLLILTMSVQPFFTSVTYAQTKVDPDRSQGKNPGVEAAANGTTVVNIRTPNKNGLSHNQYRELQVGASGIIFNNSGKISSTQLAGHINGNPYLAGAHANRILNEVTGSVPTRLNGYMEVAGNRADIIIANPNGIVGNNFGFINTNRAVMTTGIPQIHDGNLTGFLVSGGEISIQGQGMDASTTTKTDIIANAVKINAALHATDLNIVTGSNNVDYNTGAVTALENEDNGGISLDVAALGSMYAGRITLVGTRKGLGVNTEGTISATSGDLTLTQEGKVVLNGRTQAAQNIAISAQDSITNTGILYAQQDIGLAAQGALTNNDGIIKADGRLGITATGDITNTKLTDGGQIEAANISMQGKDLTSTGNILALTGDLSLNQAGRVDLSGETYAAGNLNLTAGSDLSQTGTLYSKENLLVSSGGRIDNLDGIIKAEKSLSLTAQNDITNLSGERGSQIVASKINLKGANLDSTGDIFALGGNMVLDQAGHVKIAGKTQAAGDINITAQTDIEQTGILYAQGDMELTADGQVSNEDGTIKAERDLKLTTTGDITNTKQTDGGRIEAASVSMQGKDLTSTGNILALEGDMKLKQAGKVELTGTTYATGKIDLNAQGDVTNKGTLYAQGKLELEAGGKLTNLGGIIKADEELELTAQDDITNTSQIEAASISMQGKDLTSTGNILALDGDLTLEQAGRVELSGTTYTTGKLKLKSQNEVTNKGTLYAQNQLDITAKGAFSNLDGIVKTEGKLAVEAQEKITNTKDTTGGQIEAASIGMQGRDLTSTGNILALDGDLSLEQKGQVDLSGTTYATGTLKLTADSDVTNEGTLYAQQNMAVSSKGKVANTQGTIKADGELSLKVKNSLSNADNSWLEASGITIESESITNQGTINNTGTKKLSVTTGDFDNSSGQLVSTGELAVTAKTLSNQDGLVYGKEKAQLGLQAYHGAGEVLSVGDMQLTVASDLTNTGSIQSGGNLKLTVTGKLENQKELKAGEQLEVTATSLDNNSEGEIAAVDISLSVDNTMSNTGLINAAGQTYLKGQTINNTGTGRIYGNHIAVQANTLNNLAADNRAAVIAARERMDLGVQTINNKEHALLLSMGDMSIGGSLNADKNAFGQSSVINNNSATIEATDNLWINAYAINNTNEHYRAELEIISTEYIEEYEGTGLGKHGSGYVTGIRYELDESADVYIYHSQSDYLNTPEGRYENWNAYKYTRTTWEHVVKETDPGRILSGGSMLLNVASTLTNDKSQIVAGGNLTVCANDTNNIEADAQRHIEDLGTVTSYWRKFQSGKDTTRSSTADYEPAKMVENIILPERQQAGNTKIQGSGVEADDYEGSAIKDASAEKKDITVSSSEGISALGSEQPGIATGEQINIADNAQIKLNNLPSLYLVNEDPTAKYLIETDPAFTNYKKFISSDYFFQMMQYEADFVLKRIGDGYYEQQLIKDQILQLTGNRFVKGFSTDEEQYKALMESAAKFAQSTGAVIGVALTEEQRAGLTESIVWMVEKEVMLPDGKIVKALVPEVYLSPDVETGVSPAVISGQNVNFDVVNDILNKGTIQAANTVQISATNINNVGGTITGSNVALDALKDINNLGGSLIANDSMSLSAGRDINIASTLNTQTSLQGHTTNIGAVGTVLVKGEQGSLTIDAGRDINITAGFVANEGTGDTNISAGNNLNINTVTVSNSNNIVWDANNKRSDSSSAEVGSVVSAGGNLNLQAGNDINARAATVMSEQDMVLAAGGGIEITAGRETTNIVEDHKHTGKSGGGSKLTIVTHNDLATDTSIGSSFAAGGNITMQAGEDVNIKGSSVNSVEGKITISGENVNITTESETISTVNTLNEKKKGLLKKGSKDMQDEKDYQLVSGSSLSGNEIQIDARADLNIQGSTVIADQDINLNAGKDINIESSQEDSSSYYYYKEKTSGLMGGGGLGFSIGKEEQKNTQRTNNVEQVGSTIASLEGSVNINAGNDVNIKASDVIAYKDINIEGNSVNIESADNTYEYYNKYEYKKSGLTVSLGGKAVSALTDVYQPLKRADEVSSSRLKDLYHIEAAWKGYDVLSNSKDLFNKGGFAIGVGIGSAKAKSEINSNSTIATGSNIIATGNINITAREKDLNITGSNVVGENVTLQAKENVNIEASANTNTTNSSSSSSATNIGVDIGFAGGITGKLETGKTKGKINENGVVWNESTVTANDTLIIKSGEDTNIIGSQIKGETINMEVGKDLNIESLQDTENYKEQNKQSGLNLSNKFSNGEKLNVGGGSTNQKINSEYTSVQEQAGIFAGEGGFDIEVGGNTDLKGAVIASEADPEDNRLSTGSLTYSDLENEAKWEAKTSGNSINIINGDIDPLGTGLGLINKGIAGSEGEASSITKSAIAEGEIEIRDNLDQDISDLSRDTDNANNPLNPIFDRDKILEKQEAAEVFGRLGFKLVGDISDKMHWEDGDPEKILLHALIGGIMADINGGKFGEGMTVAAINEILLGMLDKNKDKLGLSDHAIVAISNIVGQAIGGNQGGGIAESAANNNWLTHEEEKAREEARKAGDEELVAFYDDLDSKRNAASQILGIDNWKSIDWNDSKNSTLKDELTKIALEIDKLPELSIDWSDPKAFASTTAVAVVGSAFIIYKMADGNLSKLPLDALTNVSARDRLLNSVSNVRLKNTINELYRPNASTGDGGLAAAIRHELRTGELVGGKSHLVKGTERVANLERLIKNEKLTPNELILAKSLLKDLQNALLGK